MQIIQPQPLPNQQLQVQLAGQSCSFAIRQTTYGLFMDVYVSGILVIGGVICQNLNRIVRSAYLGFIGDLVWLDTQGTTDPVYTGLGSRYLLVYVEASELPSDEAQ